jgi:hypothetical protein
MTDSNNDNFVSSAWLLEGITGAVYGNLKLVNKRLSFTIGERKIFNVPLSEVKNVVFPWYYFSGGVKFRIGAGKYRLSFVEPNCGPGYPDISGGRRIGKIWKSLLQG